MHARFGMAQMPNSACPNGLCGFVLALLRFVTQCPSVTLMKLLWQLLKVCRCPQACNTVGGVRGGGRFWKRAVFVCARGRLMPIFAKPFYALGPVCSSLQRGDRRREGIEFGATKT